MILDLHETLEPEDEKQSIGMGVVLILFYLCILMMVGLFLYILGFWN